MAKRTAVHQAENDRVYLEHLRQQVLAILGDRCCFCRRTRDEVCMDAAHVDYTEMSGSARGQRQRYRNSVRHPDRYRAMCRRCHRTFDLLSRIHLKRIEAELEAEGIEF